MNEHLDNLYAFYGEYTGVRVARKHIAWYSKGHRNGAVFRQQVNRAESIVEQLRLINNWFDRQADARGMAA